jgi:predicted metalloprotease
MKILASLAAAACMSILAFFAPAISQSFELEESTYKAKEALDQIFTSQGLRKPRMKIVNSLLGSSLTKCSSGSTHGYTKVTKQSGPFYCPLEHTFYMPARFLEVFLYDYGPGAVSFVTAHEIGHAYQSQMGWQKQAPHHEYQADCIAGAVMRSASFSARERKEAAKAAFSVGGGSVHGSGIGRQESFMKGLKLGITECNR